MQIIKNTITWQNYTVNIKKIIKKIIVDTIVTISFSILISSCGNGGSENNNTNPINNNNQIEANLHIQWTLDGESNPDNYKDMGWHVLTATVTQNSSVNPVPVNGIIYQIKQAPINTSVTLQDINCNTTTFSKVGDSCSTYIKIAESGAFGLAQVIFTPGNPLIQQNQTTIADDINFSQTIADYRVILPIETQYYQGINLAESPSQYQIISVENGSINPINFTNIIISPTNSSFNIVHRTTNSNDPYYGNYNECAITANPGLNQVSQLTNVNENCVLIYQTAESAPEIEESAITGISTDASSFYPLNGNSYIMQANYTNSANYFSWESIAINNYPYNNSFPGNIWSPSLAYGNGRFIAVMHGNEYVTTSGITSTDGINWTQISLAGSQNWNSATYGNGRFVAVGGINNAGAVSADGINWTATTLYQGIYPSEWTSVAYGNGKFVAVSIPRSTNAPPLSAVSTDGVNWTPGNLPIIPGLPTTLYFPVITYGNGKFVMVSGYTNLGAVSTDGINWTATTLPSKQGWDDITYGNGRFVAIANSTNVGAVSSDGIHWTQTTLPIVQAWSSITYGNGVFVAVASGAGSASSIGIISTDGIHWTQTTLPQPDYNGWNSIIYADDKFFVLSNSGIQSSLGVEAIGVIENNYTTPANFIMYPTGS